VGVFALMIVTAPALAQSDDAGRDFPKTLILDEPGVDDEVSLPTFSHATNPPVDGISGSLDNDIAFEIDKRLTSRLQLQVTGGYRTLTDAGPHDRYGWDNIQVTAKFVVLDRPESESIFTAGLSRQFARTGAAGIGADTVSATSPILYVGQGFGAFGLPALLRPFAVTGTATYVVPDHASRGADMRFGQVLQLGGSLQYSFRYLSSLIESHGLPVAAEHVLAIVETNLSVPTTRSTEAGAQARILAPGLIYAGGGYQLAVEALVPLTRASGTGVGAVAQLNMSFGTLGLGSIAAPLW
jgi:hypothetical protein